MDWTQRLTGKTVVVDSAPLIYYLESHPAFYDLAEIFFSALDQKRFNAFTSSVTVAEALVYPLKGGDYGLVETYRQFFAGHLPIIPVTERIAEIAAQLRVDYELLTPDALQLATAINLRAQYFFTNDKTLKRVKDIEVLVLCELT